MKVRIILLFVCLVLAQSILAQTVLSNADSVKIEELSESYSELTQKVH